MTPQRSAQILSLLVPLGLMSGALGSQYIGGLFPCEMCMWQRWPHYAAIVLAALSFAVHPARMPLVVMATIAIAISGAIGGFHAGVEYGWWEGITSCASHLGSGGSALDRIMNAPLVRCDVAPWNFFGISLAGWNAIISLGGSLFIFALLLKAGKTKGVSV